MIYALHRKYLAAAGAIVKGDELLEIDNMVSYSGENLETFKGREFDSPCYLS